jgi:hypothetical protein
MAPPGAMSGFARKDNAAGTYKQAIGTGLRSDPQIKNPRLMVRR